MTTTTNLPPHLAAADPEVQARILRAVDDLIGCILHSDEGPYEDATDRLFKAVRQAAEGREE